MIIHDNSLVSVLLCLVLLLSGGRSIASNSFYTKHTSFNWGSVEINGVLTEKEKRKLRGRNIEFVFLLSGADESLLTDRSLFRKLREAYLATSSNQSRLAELAKNFSKLTELSIEQSEPLSEKCVPSLQRLKALTFLQLECPLQAPPIFWKSLPIGLETLLLIKTGLPKEEKLPSLNLPALETLSLSNEEISNDFVLCLDAPKISEISIAYATLQPGALLALSRFPKLAHLYIYRVKFNEDELRQLHLRFPELKITPSRNPKSV